MPKLQRLIIGAPFGNYWKTRGATRTLGTFTRYARRTSQIVDGEYQGRNEDHWWRGMLLNVLKTLRYNHARGGWVNRLGLRNPGLRGFCREDQPFCQRQAYLRDKIVSIHGFNRDEWRALLHEVSSYLPLAIELNLSCPNVQADTIEAAQHVVEYARDVLESTAMAHYPADPPRLIAKLPPHGMLHWAQALLEVDPQLMLHCSNTIPTERGGLSGHELFVNNMKYIPELKRQFHQTPIIFGGGIRSLLHLEWAQSTGADHFAIASVLLNPFNWRVPRRLVRFLEAYDECLADSDDVGAAAV